MPQHAPHPPTRPRPVAPPFAVARGVQKVLQDYRNLQDIIAILGMDELSEEVSRACNGACGFDCLQAWLLSSCMDELSKALG